jgi:hypothetical protein
MMGPPGNRCAPVHAAIGYGEAGSRTACPGPRSGTWVGETAALRGRRAGNVILPAGNVPMIKLGKHERVPGGADSAEFVGGAKARLDEPA